jgi:crotonobetainyl-CoA:carnitine CoA-transferase CaiB-like acyl-CoA transferase
MECWGWARVFTDPQVRSRACRVALPHPQAGVVPQVASPLRLSETPVEYRCAPPALGADTDAILADLGYDSATLARLRATGVI